MLQAAADIVRARGKRGARCVRGTRRQEKWGVAAGVLKRPLHSSDSARAPVQLFLSIARPARAHPSPLHPPTHPACVLLPLGELPRRQTGVLTPCNARHRAWRSQEMGKRARAPRSHRRGPTPAPPLPTRASDPRSEVEDVPLRPGPRIGRSEIRARPQKAHACPLSNIKKCCAGPPLPHAQGSAVVCHAPRLSRAEAGLHPQNPPRRLLHHFTDLPCAPDGQSCPRFARAEASLFLLFLSNRRAPISPARALHAPLAPRPAIPPGRPRASLVWGQTWTPSRR